ncbi:hypothetical protein [Mycolicibacterium murale]|uniref:hypothetical protein n=1 Tax=Mycolicibacterium murale TaxID=182220 RepID=UPI0021F3388D|nr:hypothetical protein [Mycolicibacterium murale]
MVIDLHQALVLELPKAGANRHPADAERLRNRIEVESLPRREYALHDRFPDEGLGHAFHGLECPPN